MDSERTYTANEIPSLMKQGAVFRVVDYGDSNEVYWDKEKETYMYKGGHRESVPEIAVGALRAYSYILVRNASTKRLNPWSV